jgi:molecular chaperone GrpE
MKEQNENNKTFNEEMEIEEKADEVKEEEKEPAMEKGSIKKIAALEDKIKSLEASNAEYLSALQRERADLQNFRKRNQAAAAESYASGTADTIAAILPVLDNFERALCSVSDEEKEQPFTKGVFMVYKQMQDILAGMGLAEIEAHGEPFDPNLHHAVMQEAAEDGQEEGCVAEVFGKGYTLNGKVIRHSMVKVAGS